MYIHPSSIVPYLWIPIVLYEYMYIYIQIDLYAYGGAPNMTHDPVTTLGEPVKGPCQGPTISACDHVSAHLVGDE